MSLFGEAFYKTLRKALKLKKRVYKEKLWKEKHELIISTNKKQQQNY